MTDDKVRKMFCIGLQTQEFDRLKPSEELKNVFKGETKFF